MKGHFRNASWSGLATALRTGSGLLNSLLAVRLIGVGDYGHLVTFLSFFVLYLSLNSSVFTVLVVKLMAQARGADATDRSDLIAAAVTFAVGSLTVLAAMTLLVSGFAPHLLSGNAGAPMFMDGIGLTISLMGILTSIQILSALQSALVESAGRLDLAMKCQLPGPFVVLGVLTMFFSLGLPITTSSYVLLLCAGATVELAAISLAKRALIIDADLRLASPRRLSGLTSLLKSGGLLQAASLMNMFLEPLNKVLLNHFAGASSVTVYDVAMKVIWGIQSLFGAMMRVFLHLGSQDREAVGRGFLQAVNLLSVPVVIFHAVGTIFLFLIARYWLSIDGSQLLVFFAIATFSNLAMIWITPLYVSLIGRGDLGFIFRSQAILAITNVLVSLALIPRIGLIGAAFGLLAATAYNSAAIYRRCGRDAMLSPGLGQMLGQGKWRYFAAVGLFFAALSWSLLGGESLVVLCVILLCLIVVALREPVFVSLVERVWQRA